MHRVQSGKVSKGKGKGRRGKRTISTRVSAAGKNLFSDDLAEAITQSLKYVWNAIKEDSSTQKLGSVKQMELRGSKNDISYDSSAYLTYEVSNQTPENQSQEGQNKLRRSPRLASINRTEDGHQCMTIATLGVNPVDTFFALMANTVKCFKPKDQLRVKDNVFKIVQNMEARHIEIEETTVNPENHAEICAPPVEEAPVEIAAMEFDSEVLLEKPATPQSYTTATEVSEKPVKPEVSDKVEDVIKSMETRSQQTNLLLPPLSLVNKFNLQCC